MGIEEKVLLEVIDVKKYFPVQKGTFGKVETYVRAVDGVSFKIKEGETFGLVGESGCGKTTLGRVILNLTPPTSGKIIFNGIDLSKVGKKEMWKLRKEMQIIFQDPYSSLNPRIPIGNAIAEGMKIHKMYNRKERKKRLLELIKEVGLEEDQLNRYPHEFSGGQRQRIGIARALALNPKFIVADEPVASLDVSIQAQIINLLKDLQAKYNLSYLFISHDLNVIENICNRIAVMYLGKIVEMGKKEDIYSKPLHPYTRFLLLATPTIDVDTKKEKVILGGDVPSPLNPPSGCRFHPRCPYCQEKCKKEEPKLIDFGNERFVACHYPLK